MATTATSASSLAQEPTLYSMFTTANMMPDSTAAA